MVSLVVGAACGHPAGKGSKSEPMSAPGEMTAASPTADPKRVVPGIWGGEHVRLQITEEGAELEFDCAHGTIPSPIEVDGGGQFDVAGVLVRERPGPIRVGHEPKSQTTSYSGSIKDSTMTLQVTLTDSGETVGTYSLAHGSEGRIRKCR
jgi:hypothetical protein